MINTSMKSDILEFLTYNIHSGRNLYLKPTLKQIIPWLNTRSPQVLALQEVNENPLRGYQLTQLKQSLNFHWDFAPNVKIGGGYYGVATGTSLPTITKEYIPMPSGKEQRGLLVSILNHREQPLYVLNTHLGLTHKERGQQFQSMEDYLLRIRYPFALLGDFNTDQPPLTELSHIDPAKATHREHIATLLYPRKRIDYILLSPHFEVLDYQVFVIPFSDHYPVWVKARLKS